MNETYKWLYDYYALPLMKVGKQADALKERIGKDKQYAAEYMEAHPELFAEK